MASLGSRSLSISVALAASIAAFALAGCPRPTDYTPQITVVPGAARRIGLLASRAPRPPKSELAPARVHPLRAGDELGGPNAVGKPGDLVLENDEVVFVIDKLGGGSGFAESGGNIVDAADAITRRDELGQLFTFFGTFPRQGVYDALTSSALPDGSAFVEVKGRELYEPAVAVTTRYTLRAGDRALLLETTLESAADHPVDGLRLGDAIQWGGAEKFAPGKSVGFRGPSSGAFIGGVGRAVSYATTSTEGAVEAVSGSTWTDTMLTPPLTLKPRERVQYARVFVVGQRGDTASVVTELGRVAGAPAGTLDVTLVDAQGKAVRVPDGAKVVLALPSGDEVLSLAAERARDADVGDVDKQRNVLRGDVPPGSYKVTYTAGGGRRGLASAVAHVEADKVAGATIAVSAAGRLTMTCTEATRAGASADSARPVPCKITLEGLDGARAPDFGPAHYAGPAANQITTGADGRADVPLAPGRYRVTASRGPEYALVQTDETIVADVTTERAAVLRRVVDTRGYLATDFHQHTMLGADAPVGVRDRVLANAAEGVEIAVASEHNVVADLQPIVREMSLASFLVELVGNEITTDANKKPWGHANVFPLPVVASKPRGGASVGRDRSPREVFAELRALGDGEPRVIQINHPRTGITGYFDQLKLDPKTGTGSDADYDPGFDALEVWNGRNVDGREKVTADFLAMLRTGHPVTATADTDTHGVVGQEAGYPRTYVRVENDGELAAWDAARSRDLVASVRTRRDVVLTNGPFLRVRVDGEPIGGVARAEVSPAARDRTHRQVTVAVHVECAPWVDVTRVRILRAVGNGWLRSAPEAQARLEAVTLKPLPSGAKAADVTRIVDVTGDEAFVVVASGARPLTPVLAGDEKELLPFAMSGAVWIDGDGDGKALGRERASVAPR